MVYTQFFRKSFKKKKKCTPHPLPAPSALSFAQHYKIFSEGFSRMQPNMEEKKNHFPLNHFHLKIFCNEKYFTAKQTKHNNWINSTRSIFM
jgi:hypothetical protein